MAPTSSHYYLWKLLTKLAIFYGGREENHYLSNTSVRYKDVLWKQYCTTKRYESKQWQVVSNHVTRLAFVAEKWSGENRTNQTGGAATAIMSQECQKSIFGLFHTYNVIKLLIMVAILSLYEYANSFQRAPQLILIIRL